MKTDEKLRHRDFEYFAQVFTATKWKNKDLNTGSVALILNS